MAPDTTFSGALLVDADAVERKLAAILSADVVGYSRLMADDEEGTVRRLKQHREVIDGLIATHHGRMFGTAGDRVISVFASAVDAVRCAVEIQQKIAEANPDLQDERRMRFRIGVNLGDVVVEGEDLLGDGVNIAARLQALADPDGICISETIYDQIRRKLDLGYDDLGEQSVKNIPGPVRAYQVRAGSAESTPAAGPRARPRGGGPISAIAVLPLENLSGNPEEEYFADGMTETLIGDLAKISSLRVISRTSVMQYKRPRTPLPEIARELNVEAVIEGTVLRQADRVRISVQLIDARTDQHLWAERYDRDLGDVLALHSEVARTVAEQIQLTLTPQQHARLTAIEPIDPNAHDVYLKGRYQLFTSTVPSVRKAIEHFKEAIARQPDYALAHVGLGYAYYFLARPLLAVPECEVLPQAKAATMEALRLDDRLGEAHGLLGWILFSYDWNWAAAEASFERAVELSPSDPLSLAGYAHYLSTLKRHDEAIAMGKRALEVAPLDLTNRGLFGLLFVHARQYERAIKAYEDIVALKPHPSVYLSLGNTYAYAGRPTDAVDAWGKAYVTAGASAETVASIRHAFERGGMRECGRIILNLFCEIEKTRYITPGAFVYCYAALGDLDRAFEWLERAYKERSLFLAYLRSAPMVDPLRDDPRFDELLRRIGIPQDSEMNARIESPPWVAHTQHEYTAMLDRDAPGDRERAGCEYVFRRDGEYWTIAYEGGTVRLGDTKGLQHLAQLLGHPGQEFHVLDLTTDAAAELGVAQEAPGAALDPEAKRAYRGRLEELREEQAEAEGFHDLGRAERARQEIEGVTQQLAAAVGLGGRDRPAGADAERARSMVTHRIKAAMKKVAAAHPALGHHLASSIKTGYFCAYTPDPAHSVAWDL